MATVHVGTCGYGYWDAPEDYGERYPSKLGAFADHFGALELNKPFYGLPQVSTAERWRREIEAGRGPDAPGERFALTTKAWQALTHPTSSPTWRDVDALTDAQREGFGYLRPNEPVRAAWADTRAVAEAMGAEVVVLQTPPSFDATEDHAADMRDLLGSIDRGDLVLAWEPRGDWLERREWVADLCRDLDLLHVADLGRERPVDDGQPWAYTRLHGLNEARYDYDYRYTDGELDDLAGELRALGAEHERVYCLFNNFGMYEDAAALRARLD